MKIIKITMLILFTTLIACNREESLSSTSVIDKDRTLQEEIELDKWIAANITLPYGISVEYTWDKNMSQKGSFTYPPNIEKVKPVLETIKALFLELYEQEGIGGKDFWKGKNPLKIHLYGGKNLDNKGYELIGNESAIAKEMFIYDVNNFDVKDENKVFVLMRNVHHQFAKLLAEIYKYNRYEFAMISNKDYRETMNDLPILDIPQDGVAIYTLKYYPKKRDLSYCNQGISFQYFNTEQECITAHENSGIDAGCYFSEYTQEQSNKEGFFTFHSMLFPENDFAEIISIYLTSLPIQIENAKAVARIPRPDNTNEGKIKNKAKAERAYQNLVKKQQFIENYFTNKVGISIKRLQLVSLQRINSYINKEN